MRRSQFKSVTAVSLASLIAAALAACGSGEAQTPPSAQAPPKVVAVAPTVRTITDWDEYTGRFTAVESVEVRARVGGYLTAIHFKDGQMVKAGDPLFTIDPRPFEAAVGSAEADVKVAEAALDFARREVERSSALRGSAAIPERVHDERVSAERQGEARVLAAKAALERAKLDLEFTAVRAPVAGRIDNHVVSVGNLVNGGSGDATLLTNIVSLNPIHVTFDVDQTTYLKYVRAAKDGTRPSSRDTPNPVRIGLPGDKGFPIAGKMNFVSNQIDRASATVRARAVVENDDHSLAPGLFAKVQLVGSGAYEAVMIPDEAIATDQASRVVFVIVDGKAELRTVTLGPIVDGLRVVRSGLSRNEVVVVSGLQRIRAGQEVAVATKPPAVETAKIEPREIVR